VHLRRAAEHSAAEAGGATARSTRGGGRKAPSIDEAVSSPTWLKAGLLPSGGALLLTLPEMLRRERGRVSWRWGERRVVSRYLRRISPQAHDRPAGRCGRFIQRCTWVLRALLPPAAHQGALPVRESDCTLACGAAALDLASRMMGCPRSRIKRGPAPQAASTIRRSRSFRERRRGRCRADWPFDDLRMWFCGRCGAAIGLSQGRLHSSFACTTHAIFTPGAAFVAHRSKRLQCRASPRHYASRAALGSPLSRPRLDFTRLRAARQTAGRGRLIGPPAPGGGCDERCTASSSSWAALRARPRRCAVLGSASMHRRAPVVHGAGPSRQPGRPTSCPAPCRCRRCWASCQAASST
jgi:hypothetical protein